METEPYLVKKGDCLVSIAERRGLLGDWRKLWVLQPKEFQKTRNPMLIKAGETIVVPKLDEEPPSLAQEATHTLQHTWPDNDLIAFARDLHLQMVAAREHHAEYYHIEENALRRAIAETVRQLVAEDADRFKDRYDPTALSQYFKTESALDDKRRKDCEMLARELCDVMSLRRFQVQLLMRPAAKQEEVVAELFDGLSETVTGSAYIAAQLSGNSVKRGTVLKVGLTAVAGMTRNFLAILTEVVRPFAAVRGEQAFQIILSVLKKKTTLTAVNLSTGIMTARHVTTAEASLTIRSFPVLVLNKKGLLDKVGDVARAESLGFAVATLNLTMGLWGLRDAWNTGKKGDVALASMSLVSPVAGLLEAWTTAANGMQKIGLLRIVGKSTAVSVLSIIGGIFDCVLGTAAALELSKLGDRNAAFGAALTAGAGFLGAVGTAFAFTTSLGSVATPLLIVSAILGIIGAVIWVLGADDPLQIWVMNTDFGVNKTSPRRGDLKTQMTELKNLYEHVELEYSPNPVAPMILIRPATLFTYSKFDLKVTYAGAEGSPIVATSLSQLQNVTLSKERVTEIMIKLPPSDEVNMKYMYHYVDVLLLVDVYGDGKWTYPQVPKAKRLTPSALDYVGEADRSRAY